MPKVYFADKNLAVEADHGESILDVALRSDIPMYHTCGGNASCSTCRVLVRKGAENLSAIESAESQILDAFDLTSPHRLGCQAQILRGDVEIEIPEHAKPCRPSKILPLPKG
ncbi:MAG: 2Fe-2S iron-sulfur cluster binding domain-containing protein [Candidatus Omnitrophica bacterium]|nr:2Fe-2S iron-sulfur cluster binding domain-containing protein [Candidatus Omnitrophota bacterium]